VLAQTPGRLVLVAHSYGGAVITNAAASNRRVKALVYVDAFVPDVGEDVLHLTGARSQVGSAIEFKKIPPFGENDVDIYLKQDQFRRVFARDIPPGKAAVMAVTQRPLALAAAATPTFAAAWKRIPSWYQLGLHDRVITPTQQRFMAERAGAHIVAVRSSHVGMISHPVSRQLSSKEPRRRLLASPEQP
jgi:pimeloyl-ACP methyl ester carboxylesterase